MERRRPALVLLLPFVPCTGISIAVSGSRAHRGAGFARLVVPVAAMVATIRWAQGLAGGRRSGVAG